MSSCRMMKVLAVGGNPADITLLRSVAEKEEGGVFFFPSVSGAMDWCRANSPDVAVVDSLVPPPGREELITLFRSLRDREGDIPLLLMTDAGERQLRGEALEEGITGFLDFLARPLDPVECTARIRSACAFRRTRKLLQEQRREREQAEEEMRRTAAHLRALYDASPDMIFLLDEAGAVIGMNDNVLKEYGYTREELSATTPEEATGGGFPWEDVRESIREALAGGRLDFEKVARRKNGGEFPVTVRLRKWGGEERSGGEEGRTSVVAVVRDIARWKLMEQQLHTLAFFDSLTGLPNRTLFFDRLHHAIAFARRDNRMVGLLFLDLDGFQSLNDTFGHSAGDLVLGRTAKRLKGCVRESDTVARMGSDEFALILTAITKEQDAALVSEKIIHTFDTPFLLDGKECFLGASIGISLYPDNGDDVHTLLKKADIAMCRVKDRGRNSYKFYRETV